MAIDIQYGPISTALGLARLSGLANRQRVVNSQDMDFLNYMQGAQNSANQQYASQVQRAIGVQQFNTDAALRQQGLTAENNRANAQMGLNNQEFQFRMQDAARSADMQQQRLDQMGDYQQGRLDLANQKYTDKTNAIGQLAPEDQAVVAATGRMPWVSRGADPEQSTIAQQRLLQAQEMALRKTMNNFTVDPKDIIGPRSQQGTIPGVAKGMESQYQAVKARLDDNLNRQKQAQDALDQFMSAKQTAAVAHAAAARQQAAQPPQDKSGGNGASSPADQAAPAPSNGQPPVVSTAQDYAQLPSGTIYINARTGQKAQKP